MATALGRIAEISEAEVGGSVRCNEARRSPSDVAAECAPHIIFVLMTDDSFCTCPSPERTCIKCFHYCEFFLSDAIMLLLFHPKRNERHPVLEL